jgi:NAD(P)-dependent dehydrogenase (short-subunit alcohol dehydrogenase family)
MGAQPRLSTVERRALEGKTVLITGATSGIGKETAVGLANMGARVVLVSRDEERGRSACEEITERSGNRSIEFFLCDLASFESIRSFCSLFKQERELHVLVNNAGVWNFTRRASQNGIESTFATNYLAPFLMTNLLLGILKKCSPSRIINVSSQLHSGTINFDDIEFRLNYSGMKAYSQSKLALILFTRLLAEKLEGTGVTVNALHPGFVSTDLARDGGLTLKAVFRLFGKNPEKGADTSVYVASSPDVNGISGEYFVDRRIALPSKESHDMDMARRLWEVSERYVIRRTSPLF